MPDIFNAYIGEVMLFSGRYVPHGWLACDGKKLPVQSNQALFAIIGNRYGGDGRVSFCIPDLRGVFPTGVSKPEDIIRRKASAVESEPGAVALTAANLPAHSHSAAFNGTETPMRAPVTLKARPVAGADKPAQGSYLGDGGAGTEAASIYVPANSNAPEVELGGASLTTKLTPAGDVMVDPAVGPMHPLQIPFIELQFCICARGLFPPRSWED